jgi:uncharacterized protein YegL
MQNEFIRQDAKPLPVILLLDVSGSMDGYKIDALNQSVRQMIASFADEESTKAEIHVSIITFGGAAELHIDMTPASQINWDDLVAEGNTPLGAALRIAKQLVEDKGRIPSRAYRPCVILVSDGQPNDQWKSEMDSFIREGRSAKCDRWALGVGDDVDVKMLKSFLNDPEKSVFEAEDASDIQKFFRFITMSTTTRSKSADPNVVTNDVKAFDPFANDSLGF